MKATGQSRLWFEGAGQSRPGGDGPGRGPRPLQSRVYEVFDHTADLGIRAEAPDLDGLLAECARGLVSTIVADPGQVRPVEERRVRLPPGEPADLLFDWLAEVLYLIEAQRFLPAGFEVRTGPGGLEATVRGERLDPARHRLEREVKAITYHGLRAEPGPDGWRAEVVVDI